jgi:acetyl-CoA C-acetyltransferase
MSEDIYIVAARRTPIGSFQGALSALSAPQLGAAAAQAAIKDSGIDAAQIDETIFGCVLMAGIGRRRDARRRWRQAYRRRCPRRR